MYNAFSLAEVPYSLMCAEVHTLVNIFLLENLPKTYEKIYL